MIETIFRTKSAISQMNFIAPDAKDMADKWLRFMTVSANPMIGDSCVSYTLDANGTDFSLDVTLATKDLAKQYLEFMQVSNLPEIEQKVFFKAVKSLPGDLHVWLQMAFNGQSTGWQVNGLLPLTEAWSYISDDIEPLLKPFFAQNNITACTSIGRTVSGGARTMFQFELGGGSIDDDLSRFLNLCRFIKITPIPTPILDLVSAQNPDYIEVVLHLSGINVLKAGIRIPNPSEALVLQCTTALGDEDAAERIGQLEGSLDVDEVSFLEILRSANGIECQVVYQREE